MHPHFGIFDCIYIDNNTLYMHACVYVCILASTHVCTHVCMYVCVIASCLENIAYTMYIQYLEYTHTNTYMYVVLYNEQINYKCVTPTLRPADPGSDPDPDSDPAQPPITSPTVSVSVSSDFVKYYAYKNTDHLKLQIQLSMIHSYIQYIDRHLVRYSYIHIHKYTYIYSIQYFLLHDSNYLTIQSFAVFVFFSAFYLPRFILSSYPR